MTFAEIFKGTRDKNKKRVGRGIGSGKGKTSGRGTKGQNSRSGANRKIPLWFEGGQTPVFRKLPKTRGFSRPKNSVAITTATLMQKFKKGETVSPATLLEKGLLKPAQLRKTIKIIRSAEGAEGLKFEGVKLSKSLVAHDSDAS